MSEWKPQPGRYLSDELVERQREFERQVNDRLDAMEQRVRGLESRNDREDDYQREMMERGR